MFEKKKNTRVSWNYLKKKHPDLVEDLKALEQWEKIKGSVVEAEGIGDYSIVCLTAITEVYKELKSRVEYSIDQVENLNMRLESVRSEYEQKYNRLEKEIKGLEDRIEQLERETLVLSNLNKVLPRINELEERLEYYPIEVANKLKDIYEEKIEEEINRILQERLKELEEGLRREALGVSVDLAKTLKEIQSHYEDILRENYSLKEEVKAKNRLIAELKQKIATLQKQLETVEDIEKELGKYREAIDELTSIKAFLTGLTGTNDTEEALRKLKEYVPRTKVRQLVEETKKLLVQIEELKQKNEQLREENSKLNRTLEELMKGKKEEEEV
ncbi:hypothetical protein A3L12_07525 [Thermococcus sp. P6]|uniref:hypothetical protein n=1 Tax=Thermococcus sp. P6 TaxID=122420 RepID=UPI000B59E408|nr:hypothetical protein [Thermococcus sp. P6]ASJ11155.1 hypothetical protein A3L12_07525 [Thermococcus sp. P6]